MDRSRLEIQPKVWLDCRRAVFLEAERLLAVADLHLGYAWAHRFNGQMLPLQSSDALLERLTDLCRAYRPEAIALLGDIVHQAAPVAAIAEELIQLLRTLSGFGKLHVILGNHDRALKNLNGIGQFDLYPSFRAGDCLLVHGHESIDDPHAGLIIMGHEHPSLSLGDGIASAKFPCFVIGEKLLILPAFSAWAAGTNIRAHRFNSPLAREVRPRRAVAICGTKLLPVDLS